MCRNIRCDFFSVYEVYGVETKQGLSDFCEVLFRERRRTRVGFVFPSVRVVTWRQEQRRAGGADPSARADARWSVATATGWGMELQVEFRENPSYLLRFLSAAPGYPPSLSRRLVRLARSPASCPTTPSLFGCACLDEHRPPSESERVLTLAVA